MPCEFPFIARERPLSFENRKTMENNRMMSEIGVALSVFRDGPDVKDLASLVKVTTAYASGVGRMKFVNYPTGTLYGIKSILCVNPGRKLSVYQTLD